ncbi:MAG: hypothetical protein CMH26_08710 [Micavibrio sp.]|nr:hypothetical protein [Micavibrio sp.]|tara:strand:- start:533 stop:2122 length:1590 start_codon:yes stop_codon:yes gene_type:complete
MAEQFLTQARIKQIEAYLLTYAFPHLPADNKGHEAPYYFLAKAVGEYHGATVHYSAKCEDPEKGKDLTFEGLNTYLTQKGQCPLSIDDFFLRQKYKGRTYPAAILDISDAKNFLLFCKEKRIDLSPKNIPQNTIDSFVKRLNDNQLDNFFMAEYWQDFSKSLDAWIDSGMLRGNTEEAAKQCKNHINKRMQERHKLEEMQVSEPDQKDLIQQLSQLNSEQIEEITSNIVKTKNTAAVFEFVKQCRQAYTQIHDNVIQHSLKRSQDIKAIRDFAVEFNDQARVQITRRVFRIPLKVPFLQQDVQDIKKPDTPHVKEALYQKSVANCSAIEDLYKEFQEVVDRGCDDLIESEKFFSHTESQIQTMLSALTSVNVAFLTNKPKEDESSQDPQLKRTAIALQNSIDLIKSQKESLYALSQHIKHKARNMVQLNKDVQETAHNITGCITQFFMAVTTLADQQHILELIDGQGREKVINEIDVSPYIYHASHLAWYSEHMSNLSKKFDKECNEIPVIPKHHKTYAKKRVNEELRV